MPRFARRAGRVELMNDGALNQREAKALLKAARYAMDNWTARFTAREAQTLESAWSKLEWAIRMSQPER